MKEIQIIGLGYVGLPLALLCDKKGLKVKGYDIDKDKIKSILNKIVTVDDVTISSHVKNHNLTVNHNIEPADVHIICVPTPIDRNKHPDISIIKSVTRELVHVIKDNDLIIIESTIYPGLCNEEIVPILNKSNKTYLLAHCPERINPGDKKFGIQNINRIVGGINKDSVKAAYEIYSQIIDAKVMQLNSIKSAEATKILENIFRDVNIALVNEMAQAFYRMDIDTIEVIKAASTKPFSFLPHYPGVGVGGHCIAIDPYYMIEKGKASGFDHEFLTLARKINEYMPIYSVNLLQNTLNLHARTCISVEKIGIYGLSYKSNIGDDRESPSYQVIKKLKEEKGANVYKFDPYLIIKSDYKTVEDFLKNITCLMICTSHSEILEVDWRKYPNLKVIIDGRNCIKSESMEQTNIIYKGIGVN
tara:strand:+ start:7555 stop:8805 length:1251 start_codon:yes stop_codon:yes gene_type:complete